MANTVSLKIKIDDDGSLSIIAKEAKKAKEGVESVSKATNKGAKASDNYSKKNKGVAQATSNGTKAYSLISMMSDLRKGVWSEIYTGKSIDTYRRNLQRAYLDRLDYLLNKASDQRGVNSGYRKSTAININQSDVKSVARGELKRLQRDAKSASNRGNTLTRYHLQDVVDRIETILDPK